MEKQESDVAVETLHSLLNSGAMVPAVLIRCHRVTIHTNEGRQEVFYLRDPVLAERFSKRPEAAARGIELKCLTLCIIAGKDGREDRVVELDDSSLTIRDATWRDAEARGMVAQSANAKMRAAWDGLLPYEQDLLSDFKRLFNPDEGA